MITSCTWLTERLAEPISKSSIVLMILNAAGFGKH